MTFASMCLAIAIAIAPRVAGADTAAPIAPPTLSAIGPAGVTTPLTPLTIDSASLRIDCVSRATCSFEARYAISNPTDALVEQKAVFQGTSTRDMNITVNGAPLTLSTDDGTISAPHRVAIAVGPKATAKVIVTGTIASTIQRSRTSFEWAAAPDTARHLLLAPETPTFARVQLEYVAAPLRRWGVAPKDMTVTLVLPEGWHPSLDGPTKLDELPELDQSRSPDGRTIHEATVPTTIHSLMVDLFIGQLDVGPRVGVFAGIGGHYDDATGLRTRIGGELAWRRRYFTSLALEIEWDDPRSFVIVPAFAIASTWLVFIPSVGVGAGIPMRVSPSFELGGRIQLDAHLGPVGYFVALDYYPGMDPGPHRFEASMMAVLSI